MRVCIIGHFGGGKTFMDGQTVKTVAVYEALKRYGIRDIDQIDTYYAKKSPALFWLRLIRSLFRSKKYIVLLSRNGRKMLFPVLFCMSRFLGKEIYHYSIGGRLAREVESKAHYKKYVSSFKSNWVESVELAELLQESGVRNAIYLPNFKKLDTLSNDDLPTAFSEPFRFCTFSRVQEKKGIEDAFRAARAINEELGRRVVELDIYGPVDKDYEGKLECLVGEETRYCGVIPPNESVGVLKDYFALLFPTRYKHEGMPGTIIDGLSAGLPVIARRWQYCDEMLQHKFTGYIYDFDHPEKLKEMMEYAISHVQETLQMRKNCLAEAKQYSEEYVIEYIVKRMGVR